MEVDVTERMSINPCILLIKACVVILSFRQAASHHVLIVVVTRVVNVAVRIDRYMVVVGMVVVHEGRFDESDVLSI